MAIRSSRAVGLFSGGIGRWVSVEEAREIAARVAEFETAAEVAEWLHDAHGFFGATARLYYRARLGYLDDRFDRDEIARDLIVGTAVRRRADAIRAHLEERGLRHLLRRQPMFERCPTCDRQLEPLATGRFYCDDHRDDERAEVDRLSGVVA